MKIGVVSDGQYGERAFEQIKKRFNTLWILLPFPSSPVVDEIEYEIPLCDLYLSYLRHPDVTLYLIRMNRPVILGVNHGPGFLVQAHEFNQAVFGPETMCSLIPNTDTPEINEYAKVFGRPVFHLVLDRDLVEWCCPLRGSPCGSTEAAALEIHGQTLNQETINRFALSICHNCRAPRFGKTCDKEKAGIIHLEELMKAVKAADPDLWERVIPVLENILCSDSRDCDK